MDNAGQFFTLVTTTTTSTATIIIIIIILIIYFFLIIISHEVTEPSGQCAFRLRGNGRGRRPLKESLSVTLGACRATPPSGGKDASPSPPPPV
ncbi:unnamed protein product [Boreogadus saida]